MSIGVQSYPELYTMIFGWDLYDKLWVLLTETGIAYIPFMGLILRQIHSSYVHAERGAGHSLRSMEISLLTMMLIIFFAASPSIPLSVDTVSFTPMCAKSPSTFHPGDTGTTYDNSFVLPNEEIRVPIWWYSVIAVSEGITASANTMVGCVPDIRKLATEVNMTKITDPELVSQVQDFASMCYAPARTEYFADTRDGNSTRLNSVERIISEYGKSDSEWIGSHAFQETYYPNLKATRPIPPFPYQKSDDLNGDNTNVTPPTYGTPTCAEWWKNPQYGIAARLYKIVPELNNPDFKVYFDEVNKDLILKNMLAEQSPEFSGYDNGDNIISSYGPSSVVARAGVFLQQTEEYPKIYAASQAAPIIQALLLLMCYAFLPFALVFTSYKPSMVITGSILLFSIIFWSFIWHLVGWVDKALITALYPNWFAKEGAGATLTDMIIGGLVLGAPLFWFMYMGSMGVAIGNAVSSAVTGMSKVGDQSAAKGSDIGKSSASNALTALEFIE